MKKFLLVMMAIGIFALPAFAFDSENCERDIAPIGSFLQKIVNPKNRNYPQGGAVYCDGYGVVVIFYTYFDSNSGCDAQFNQGNAEMTRSLALYLSAIRKLKEDERVVVAIKNTNQPFQVYTAQAQNKDIISFQQGKIKLEDFAKRIRIGKSVFVEK